jgi:glycosyltransferase involved in cell wall biosynthesis
MTADRINVLQATAWYPPHSMGGTEAYLEGLIDELRLLGVESSVLVPRHATAPAGYEHAGTPVETYPANSLLAPNVTRDGRPHLELGVFQTRLAANKGAVYHQHSWTPACGPHHLRAARELGLQTVLTVHVAGNICMRGTMLRYGAHPCDGRVDERVCGACWLHERGLPRPVAGAVARLPLAVARCAQRGRTRLATALAARSLGAGQRAQIAEMVRNADRIVAVCEWLYDALAANGVPRGKLALSRQGLPAAFLGTARATTDAPRSAGQPPLKLIYLGRWHPIKGIDVIVRAIRALPFETDVRLTIHGISGGEVAYEHSVRRLANGEPRISFAAPLAWSEVAAALAEYDAIVVPSLCLETGPLVVLEARAAGLYVMGSRLGGIVELVGGDGAGGELIDAGNVAAWAAAIARLARRHASGDLRRRPRDVRTMAAAAADMAQLYKLLSLRVTG